MKFLYLVPFLLPQVASACIGGTDTTLATIFAAISLIVIFTAAINLVLLVTMRVLPSNKTLSISQIIERAKRPMLVVLVAVTVAVISLFYVAYNTTYACL